MAIERVIYGMTADYHLTGCWVLKDDNPSIEHLRYFANRIADAYPGTVHCWAIDNSPVVRHGYLSSRKGRLDDRVIFKLLLEEEGVRIF